MVSDSKHSGRSGQLTKSIPIALTILFYVCKVFK